MNPFLQAFRQVVIPRNSKREEFARSIQRNYSVIHNNFFSDYSNWIKLNEPDAQGLVELQRNVAELPIQPMICLILAIGKTTKFLHEEIESVRAQTYPKWELQIVFSDQINTRTRQELEAFNQLDDRIKIQSTPTDTDIPGRLNSCIRDSQAEFIAFLDLSDCLAPFGLTAIVQALNENPSTDVFYSDEDHLSYDGKRRFDPVFKPAFSIDYLRAFAYIQHLLVIRKFLVEQLGRIHGTGESGWEYELVLRAVEQARWITHIPQVLYHVRKSSLKLTVENENQNQTERIKSLREHLSRCGLPAEVENGPRPGLFRVTYLIDKAPLVSIIIPNHEHADDLQRCIDSILSKTEYQNYEILIVENNSHGAEIFSLYEKLKNQDGRVRVLEYTQILFNYSQINNFAVENASGEVLLFLNNDTQILEPDWLRRMLEYALRPDVGAVGAKLYFSNWLIQHAGIIIGLGVGAGHHFVGSRRNFTGYQNNLVTPQDFSAVTAACLMMRRNVFDEAGGFDEQYQLSYGDIDLCLKIRQKGYLIAWTPYAELIHFESRTRGYEVTSKQEARFTREANLFMEKWASLLMEGDPFYNPNLALTRGDFSIRTEVCRKHARHSRGLLVNHIG